MATNITGVGASGTHTFTKTTVNQDEDYIYFSNQTGETIPSSIIQDKGFIYRQDSGSIGGLSAQTLYFANIIDNFSIDFSATKGGSSVDLTASTAGVITLDDPIVYDNIIATDINYDDNQAVRYVTDGSPLSNLTNEDVYFVKKFTAEFAGATSRYDFVSATFRGLTSGRTGPNLATARSNVISDAGNTANWEDTYLNMTTQGIQRWTVPQNGTYSFDIEGAAGGAGSDQAGDNSGRGVRMRATFSLLEGDVINILVGQRGTGVGGGGGGGGTFVWKDGDSTPLIVAGGGGGEGDQDSTGGFRGVDATTSTSGTASRNGTASGGSNGQGGSSVVSDGTAGSGAGWFSDGGGGGRRGVRPLAGGFGGDNGSADGGFGGGGAEASSTTDSEGGGGGGGYSGGGATGASDQGGGGGGSFIASTGTNVATSDGQYDGSSTFNGAAITDLSAFNTGTGSATVTLVATQANGVKLYASPEDSNSDTDPIAISAAGSSNHYLLPIQLDTELNNIYSSTPHGYNSGQPLSYSSTGSFVEGLNDTTTYYANVVDPYTIKLSLTPAPTFSDVNIINPGSERDDLLSNVVVDTNLNILTINNHGFLVNQPIQYLTNGNNAIVPLQNQVTYYVKEVVNSNQIKISQSLDGPEIDFVSPGTGTNHSFIFVTVNIVEDSLYIPSHNLVSGQAVVYDNGGGTNVGGLSNGQLYYVVRVDPNIIKLSTTRDLTGVVNLSSAGTGTQSLTITSINLSTDTITIPAHGFTTGELVEYDSAGQTVITGLTSGNPYYVIVVDGDNIQLADTANNAVTGTQIDLTGLGSGTHELTSLTRTPDGTYISNTVPDATSFTAVASGIVPPIVKAFTPRTSVNIQQNAIYIPSHGFITGTEVTYSSAGNTEVTGLVDDTHYYVIVINRDWIRLSTTADNALSGVPLTVSDFGTGTDHTLTSTQISGNITGSGSVSTTVDSVLVNGTGTAFSKILKVGDDFRLFPPNVEQVGTFADSGVNTSTEVITCDAAHGLSTGDSVQFQSNGGVAPAPLVDGFWYFARELSDTQLSLHGTLVDAQNDTNRIDFSTSGSGSGFTVTRIEPSTPIIRKITAIGSDEQITVDRAYTTSYSGVSYSYPTVIYVRPQGYSLHRPFDGGVEMSVGYGTSWGQIIRQTRKYFRYQSGKGIQTSAAVNFKPTLDVETAYKVSETTIGVRTRRPHGLINGLFVVVRDALDSFGVESQVYNGRFQVTVEDELNFTVPAQAPITEDQAYGFPNLHVEQWTNGAIRAGMFDMQNGMFYEFDGQKLYAVRRSSTQQIAGTMAGLQGSELIFGTDTKFTAQLTVGDSLVLRGQTYRVTSISSDTELTVRPEYKGRSGNEVEFDPAAVVSTANDSFQIIGHGFTQNLPIVYNSIDGTPIGGLINGRTYYIELIDSNNFSLKSSPTAPGVVDLSSVGSGNPHSFVPAKTGIIGTLTVDTRVPQEEFSVDPCDGSGVTGYNLDLSRIQMIYMDYSWYGAGKIRFGFKTTDGQVQYVHEFVHNNLLNESYFRSGNMPARYEIATFDSPSYIPFLFHWGTSVIMDGQFDDDRAYLFTAGSPTLTIPGTTPKAFGSNQISTVLDFLSIPSHGFANGDEVQFLGIGTDGLPTNNLNNPRTQVTGTNELANLTNEATYYVRFLTANRLTLHRTLADAEAPAIDISSYSRNSSRLLTINTNGAHGLSQGDSVLLYDLEGGNDDDFNGSFNVNTIVDSDTFTISNPERGFDVDSGSTGVVIKNALNYTSAGQSQNTFFLFPGGTLNNTSGANYQPLLSLRLSPSVSEGLTGRLGERDIINRMQLRLREVGLQTDQLVDVKLLLNARLNNLSFRPVDSPSLVQIVEHTANDTVSGGVQVYNFKASGQGGSEQSTTVDVSELFELSNSILGGDSVFPDGPDIVTIAVARLTGNETNTSARLSWTEAQA